MRGIVFVAYGDAARREAALAIKRCPYPVAVIGDRPIDGAQFIPFERRDSGARWPKLHVNLLSPFSPTAYFDADTRISGDITAGFEIIEDGWDMAIAPSAMQGAEWLWKCTQEERDAVESEWGFRPLSLQAGVIFFAQNDRVNRFFEAWREAWRGGQDQAAILLAWRHMPIKIWLLGRPWNGGSIVQHRFGMARR